MKLTRFEEALPYIAPNHYDMRSLRLQGFEVDGPKAFWVGASHFLPGGGAGPDTSPLEKVYVMLAGELTITVNGLDTILNPKDSCTIPGGEERTVKNNSNDVASMIVIMPYLAKT